MTDLRLGLCGGTFDPIHRGHIEPLLEARKEFDWSNIVLVPAWQQPFKTGRRNASAFHRHAMAVLATEDDPLFRVSTFELDRREISYTVDTLEHYRSLYADAVIDWIIGDDNLPQLAAWKSLDRIFELANFAVLRRTGYGTLPSELRGRETTAEKRGRAGSIVFAGNALRPIASTDLRLRIAKGESPGDAVAPRVARYIDLYRLYLENEQS
ncbi:MAG: nicotinate (nicotinamide) nucleotide adenylyltransferase [Thermoanaerobaculia bacterium]